MCTHEYLVKRKRAIIRTIEQTVTLAVDGADSDSGGCFPGQFEEMRYVILTLHAQADHLGIIIGRIEGISTDEGQWKAIRIVGERIAKVVGDPPEGLSKFFDGLDLDARMN
jgi:hypothetical protein